MNNNVGFHILNHIGCNPHLSPIYTVNMYCGLSIAANTSFQ